MTTVVIADLHLEDNPRDAYRHAFMRQLPRMLEEQEASRLLILGDLTEAKDRHGAWLVNQIVAYIRAAADVCPVWVMRGNHDYIAEAVAFYQFLAEIPGVAWVDRPAYRRLGDLGKCLFLPHTQDWRRDWGELDFNVDWVFAHQTFDGAEVGGGKRLSGVPQGYLPAGVQIVSGDIHIPQTLGQVTYVGAPYTIDFGDEYEGRLLVLSGSHAESVPYRGPQKHLVSLRGDLNDVLRLQDEHPLADALPGLREGDVLKVRVHTDAADAGGWASVRKALREWADERGYVLHTVQMVVDTPMAGSQPAGREASRPSDTELVESYGRQHGAPVATIRAGLRLMSAQEE